MIIKHEISKTYPLVSLLHCAIKNGHFVPWFLPIKTSRIFQQSPPASAPEVAASPSPDGYKILGIYIAGWWFQPLWKIWKSVGMIIPNIICWEYQPSYYIYIPSESKTFFFWGIKKNLCFFKKQVLILGICVPLTYYNIWPKKEGVGFRSEQHEAASPRPRTCGSLQIEIDKLE